MAPSLCDPAILVRRLGTKGTPTMRNVFRMPIIEGSEFVPDGTVLIVPNDEVIRKQSAKDSREQAMQLAVYGLKVTGIGNPNHES